MRFGNFSLLIPEGREVNTGHVELGHGSVYTLRLANHDHSRSCDAYVTVDGKDMGAYRLRPGQTFSLERPFHDSGRFTFFKAGTDEAKQSGESAINEGNRGLVTVVFKPERQRQVRTVRRGPGGQSAGGNYYNQEIKTSGGIELTGLSHNSASCDFDADMGALRSCSPGVTGLTGNSNQQFVEVANLDYDAALEVTINLRLVAGATVRELQPARKGNDVPAPV